MMNAMSPVERTAYLPNVLADSGRAARQVAMGAVVVDAEAVRCPVLVVSAELDRISPPSIQQRMVERYGAHHVPVGGRAHLIAIEDNWQTTASVILDWAEAVTAVSIS